MKTIFLIVMALSTPCLADSTTGGTVTAGVVETITIKTPVEYAPVCKPDKISNDCIHSVEAMAQEQAKEAAQLNNLTPAAGESK